MTPIRPILRGPQEGNRLEPVTILTQATPPQGGTGIDRYTDEVSKRLVRDLGARIISIPFHGPRGPLWMRRHARLLLNKYLVRPEGRIMSFCLWLIPPGTEVATVWDIIQKPNAFVMIDRIVHYDLWRSVKVYPKKWIAISSWVRKRMIDNLGLPPGRIHVAPPGIDTETFYPMDSPAHKKMERKTILHVGICYPRKRIDLIIDALGQLGPQRFRFVRVGPIADKAYSDLCWRKAEKIHLQMGELEWVTDAELARWFNKSDLLVFPSMDEGAGMPPLEAMACGTNVVVSNIPPHQELLGHLARYARPGDADSLAGAIDLALRNPRSSDELVAHARKFSWDATAEIYKKVLTEVIN